MRDGVRLILKDSNNPRPFTSVSAVALQPGAALLLQPPQLHLTLLQLPLQKLQLLLAFGERDADQCPTSAARPKRRVSGREVQVHVNKRDERGKSSTYA